MVLPEAIVKLPEMTNGVPLSTVKEVVTMTEPLITQTLPLQTADGVGGREGRQGEEVTGGPVGAGMLVVVGAGDVEGGAVVVGTGEVEEGGVVVGVGDVDGGAVVVGAGVVVAGGGVVVGAGDVDGGAVVGVGHTGVQMRSDDNDKIVFQYGMGSKPSTRKSPMTIVLGCQAEVVQFRTMLPSSASKKLELA